MKLYQKIILLKVNLWKMVFVLLFFFSLFWNYKQNKVIKYYRLEYAYFDSLSVVHIKEIDSLETTIKNLNNKKVILDVITYNMSKEYQLLQDNPQEFANLYFNGNNKNIGGGE